MVEVVIGLDLVDEEVETDQFKVASRLESVYAVVGEMTECVEELKRGV